MTKLPNVRGVLTVDRPLNEVTWLRVGGQADLFFQPADLDDLRVFMRDLDAKVPVFPIGVGSNLIIRDGGLRAAVVRLGRGFNETVIKDNRVRAGAAALDAHVARRAADAGLDLAFLRTIPGSIGGAIRMNAGCYGSYVADHLIEVEAVARDGSLLRLSAQELRLSYRSSELPPEMIIVSALFEAVSDEPERIHEKMAKHLAKRDDTQPTKERSAGSTFRNPAGYSSTGRLDDTHGLKAWKLIQDAGMQGVPHGRAMMSTQHANFLINLGGATARDLEEMGELVRKKVFQMHKIELKWEILRVGEENTS